MAKPTPVPSLTITVHAAHVAFGDEILFDQLDFEIPGGQWTCLLGPSGIGKTTLLRLVGGLVSSGQNQIVHCSDGRPLAGRTAYMAQQDLLLPWLTVLDNVTIGARLRGEGRRRAATVARARDLLSAVGLADNAGAYPATLSGGMRQRTALARTLMEDRPVVLMDEPFSALDAITRVRLQELAARLLRDRTVLLVTHDPLEALRLGDRIHVMSGRPAILDAPLEPAGPPPRDYHDPEVLNRQADLLERLAAAGGTA